jgi:hypothetical protein
MSDRTTTSWHENVKMSIDRINEFISYNNEELPEQESEHPKKTALINEEILKDKEVSKLQHKLMAHSRKARASQYYSQYLRTASSANKARILSIRNDKAGLWLTQLPKTHTHMSSPEFITACRFRLGLSHYLLNATSRCTCKTTPIIGNEGQHFHNCPLGSERHEKHDNIVRTIDSMAKMAGCTSRMEPKNLFPFHEKKIRPDILIADLGQQIVSKCDRKLTVDVRLTHPGTDSNIRCGSAKEAGKSASRSATEKNSKFQEQSNDNDFDFLPIIFESYGHIHSDAKILIDALIVRISELHQIPKSVLTNYWYGRLSIQLQIGNAKLLNTRSRRCITKQIKKNEDLPSAIAEFKVRI